MSRSRGTRAADRRALEAMARQDRFEPATAAARSTWPAVDETVPQTMHAASTEPRWTEQVRSSWSRTQNLRTPRSLRVVTELLGRLSGFLRGMTSEASPVTKSMRRLQGRGRRLQVAETLQLGEKRFVAILRVDGEQFLIGGSTGGVSLLASLAGEPPTFKAEPIQIMADAAEPATADESAQPEASPSFSAVLAAQSRLGGLA